MMLIEQRQKISESNIGKHGKGIPRNTEFGIKVSKGKTGKKRKPFTKEHRENISKGLTGKKKPVFTEEHCENISNGLKKYYKTTVQVVSEKTKQKIREGTIKRITNQKGQCYPRYNEKACKLFDQINKEFGLNLRHAENGGEIRIIGYFVDAFDLENQLIIEYDEKHHSKPSRKLKDEIRQSRLIKKIGFTFIRLKNGVLYG